MLKRLGVLLIVVATMPLIIGAGGMGPPQVDASRKTTGPAITATIVIDPHESNTVTTTARRATIRLEKGSLVSGATFDIPPVGFPMLRGCDLNLTELRFVHSAQRPTYLYRWVPQAVLDAIFAPLGVTQDPVTNIAVITDIDDAVCTADPANPGVVDSGNTYGSGCPVPGLCTNPNHQNIIVNGGDGSPALAGILSFTAVIQLEVPH